MKEEIFDQSNKRFDTFRAVLGLSLLVLSGYLWLNYFFASDSYSSLSVNQVILLLGVVLLFVIGIYVFIVGYTQMSDNYDLEVTLIQITVIKSLERLNKLKLKELGLSKNALAKFKKYIKLKLKDLIEGFA